jgi:hypothetical protein
MIYVCSYTGSGFARGATHHGGVCTSGRNVRSSEPQESSRFRAGERATFLTGDFGEALGGFPPSLLAAPQAIGS